MASKPDRSRHKPKTRLCPRCGGRGHLIDLDLASLLPIINDAAKDRVFNVRELLTFAKTTGGPLADLLAGLSARQLGKALAFNAGKQFNGLTIKRIDQDSAGAIWMVRVDHSHLADS